MNFKKLLMIALVITLIITIVASCNKQDSPPKGMKKVESNCNNCGIFLVMERSFSNKHLHGRRSFHTNVSVDP